MFSTVSCTTDQLLIFLPTLSLFFSSAFFLLHSLLLSVSPHVCEYVFCLLLSLCTSFFPAQSLFFFISHIIRNRLTTAKSHSRAHLNTNEQPCTNTNKHPSSVSLPVGRQKRAIAPRESPSRAPSRAASRAGSQPEGCDIAVKGPEEIDNSAASGMLGPEGRNPASSEEAERQAADSRGEGLMGLPHVDNVET